MTNEKLLIGSAKLPDDFTGAISLDEIERFGGLSVEQALAPLEAGAAVRSVIGNDSDGSTLADQIKEK